MGDGRKRLEHPDGFTIIKPENEGDVVPLMCPVCSMPLLTADDAAAYRRHATCSLCELVWVDTHRERWQQGWRPDQSDVEEELKRRRLRAKPIKI